MTRSGWIRLARVGAGVVVIAGTIVTVGAAPVARGIVSITPGSVVVALALSAVASAAAAWRWTTVSTSLGVPLRWRDAFVAYYRSQFLNSVLPGGVVGDVHRAYRQGRRSDDLSTAARAVVVERVAGQLVQLPIAVIVLAATGALTALSGMLWIGVGLLVLVVGVLVIALATTRGRAMLLREATQLRQVFGSARATAQVAVSSVLVVAAHTATFVLACLLVGVTASPAELLALTTVALLGAAVPLGIGGWGPREAASASAFALVGLTASAGLAASAAFGVLTLASVLPGGIVLILDRVAFPARIRTTEQEPA